jgi:16S rRNA (uracil1498-N3)-methyltransferase
MPRLHVPTLNRTVSLLHPFALDEVSAQHARVLRLSAGDAVTLFSGQDWEAGWEARATIRDIDKKRVTVDITGFVEVSRESPLDITLVQALAVADKMDWIVQKATELGVTEIVPVRAMRSTLKLDGERAEKRVAHWQQIAVAACEQCGRNRVPSVLPIQAMPEDPISMRRLGQSPSETRQFAVLDPTAEISLLRWAEAHHGQPLGLIIGPEGGLDELEIQRLTQAGATRARFGPRVMRTETAGIAAIAAINAVLGDLR